MTHDDATIAAAVRAADTYKAAAVALGLPYSTLRGIAVRLRAWPRRLGRPSARHGPARAPASLSDWLPLHGIVVGRFPLLSTRIDQAGRRRAVVEDIGGGWCAWRLLDITGAEVGLFGLRGSQQEAEAGADEALRELGWPPPRARVDHAGASRQSEQACGEPRARGTDAANSRDAAALPGRDASTAERNEDMTLDKLPAGAAQDTTAPPLPQPEQRRCCATLAAALAPCADHPDPFECSDAVIVETSTGKFGMPIRDGGRSCFVVRFCPFCGASLEAGHGAPAPRRTR